MSRMTREENLHWLNEEIRTWENECQSKHPIKEALYAARKTLEQEPFINKVCVSSKACEHDKEVVLDKIRAEIQENINYNKKMNYQGIVAGLLLTLDIIEKYKAGSEKT